MDLLRREQVKYVFHPPRYSRLIAPLLTWLGTLTYLRRKFRVATISMEGAHRVRELTAQGHMVLVAPNHADHADPHVLAEVGRKDGLAFHYMAAREVFEIQGRIGRWALSRIGSFSVDREGADMAAIKMAMSILREARHPLVVFPEGEIFHHHEQLAPLNEGVATMLLRATKGQPAEQKAFLVPTAMRYTHDPSVAADFTERLDRLERAINWKPRPELDPVERIYRLGGGILATKEVEFLGSARTGSLAERIEYLQHELVGRIEDEHFDARKGGTTPERVKALRYKIRKELTAESGCEADREKELYDDLDSLFAAVQLFSYPGQYLAEQPTTDRIAETLLKLEEDVLGKADYPGPRAVTVRFDEPIEVGEFLHRHELTMKTATAPLTDLLATRIQSMLDALT
jgi:1-acyl-sn-glycerol-3-phosphate acyltransferase